VECAFGSTRRSYGQFSSRRLALFPPASLEATPVELPFAAVVWVAMHGAIAIVSTNHPDYLDPNLGRNISFATPLALVVKWRLA
jgi:hypothetical protein